MAIVTQRAGAESGDSTSDHSGYYNHATLQRIIGGLAVAAAAVHHHGKERGSAHATPRLHAEQEGAGGADNDHTDQCLVGRPAILAAQRGCLDTLALSLRFATTILTQSP